MRTETWHVPSLLVAISILGCPAGDDGSAGTDTDASTDTPTSSSTSPTSAASMTSTSASTSTTDGTTDDGTSSGEVTGESEPSTSEGSSGGSSGSSGGVDPCAELGREACDADKACTAMMCSVYEMNAAGGTEWCIGEGMFVGCRSADTECAMEPTVICQGDDAPIYRCREDCIPEGFMMCEAPVDGDVPACS